MSSSDIPPTDFDDIETQDEEDTVFDVKPPPLDVPDEEDGA